MTTCCARARRADPRVGARIRAALEAARTVLDLHAGDRVVVAGP